MATDSNKLDFASAINRLEEINAWFQHEDSNLDEGLEKLREGKELIKGCREKLQAVENEFIKIKQEYGADGVPVDSHPDRHAHTVREAIDMDDIPEEDVSF